jgi:hypothetical protein
MDSSDRLILWHPDDPEFPTDAWEVGRAVYWAAVTRNRDDYTQYLRDLLACPTLDTVLGLLGGIARRHGLEDDEAGRLTALHSVLLAEDELWIKRRGINLRLKACQAAEDEAGQAQALKELAFLEPCWFDNWSALIAHVEKTQSAAAALECLRPAEPYQDKDIGFRLEKLRLICACGTREEALAEGQRIREKCGEVWEQAVQADEDYLLAWRSDPDAVKLREMAAKPEDEEDPFDAMIDIFKDGRRRGGW